MRSGQAVLASALEAWQAPLTSSGNAQVMEAFANMRGVSLLLRIQPLAQLIKLCESAWLAARPTERAINTDEVRCFSQAIELFQHLSSAVGEGYAEQVANHQEKLVASLNELNQRAQSSASGSSASSSARPTVQLESVGGAVTGASAVSSPNRWAVKAHLGIRQLPMQPRPRQLLLRLQHLQHLQHQRHQRHHLR